VNRAANGPWLAIDTATDAASIGLLLDDDLVSEEVWTTRRRHTQQLAPRVSRLLDDHGLRPSDLGGIAVAIGPGSYTGLRIGLSLAKGLALAGGLDVVGVPTLDVLAAAFQPPDVRNRPTLWAVLRAGRGRIVAAAYPPVAQASPLEPGGMSGPQCREDWPDPRALTVWTADELVERVAPGDWVAGELDNPLRCALLEAGCTVPSVHACVRRAGWLATTGRARASDARRPSVADLTPVYAR
jgi:tRNA threonylcarbamoyladenosine biosynthesis protein TsaB